MVARAEKIEQNEAEAIKREGRKGRTDSKIINSGEKKTNRQTTAIQHGAQLKWRKKQ